MIFNFTSLKWIILTLIGTCNWILATLIKMTFSNIFKSRIIFLAIFTGVWSLWTFWVSNEATLIPISTAMLRLNLHKPTPSYLLLWRRILVQVLFKISKLPLPLAAQLFLETINISSFKLPLKPMTL